MSEPKTAEVKVEDAIVRDIAEQLGASIAGLGFPVGMGTAPPEEMCRRAARGIVALYGRQLSSAASASPPAETGEGEPVRETIFKALRKYKLTNMSEADDSGIGYPLIDLMSNDGTTIATGEAEMRVLADHISEALGKAAAHPASDQSDTERMRAALKRAKAVLENTAVSNALRVVGAHEIIGAALAEKAADQ